MVTNKIEREITMTQKEKDLLLQYLCMALPYGVKIKFAFNKDIEKNNNLIYVSDNEQSYIHNSCMILTGDNIKYIFNDYLDECKPYLRPMSSMTEDEKKVVCSMNMISGIELNDRLNYQRMYVQNYTIETFDYFNEHKLDYRGLIEKGLAVEVTEENNPYEN